MFCNAINEISTSNNDKLYNDKLYNDKLYNDELYNIMNPKSTYNERVQNSENIYHERVRIMNSESTYHKRVYIIDLESIYHKRVHIKNPESTYYKKVPANIMISGWNNMINKVNMLYENNQFDVRNQFESKNNFIVNSGSYLEELPIFRNWNYKDNRFSELYTNKHTKYDIISDTLYPNECNMNIENNQYYELQVGKMFLNWDYAMSELKQYEKREGFRSHFYYTKKLDNGDIQRYTIVCEHFGQPKATKSKNPKKETMTKCIEYMWQINLLCPKKDNPLKTIYIAKLVNEHKNHDLDQAHYNFQENIAFTKEMTEDVEFFQIHKALKEKYSVKVYMQVLQQVIQQFHPKLCDQTNDASKLYKELLNKKEVDPQWYVQVNWNPSSKCLLAQALMDDETKEAHSWILQQIKKAMNETAPQVIFTNADPALVAAIRDKFSTTNILNCMFHIKCLLEKYNNENVVNYLQWLYANKESWAKAFVLNYLQQGYQLLPGLKVIIQRLKELAEKLTACILEKDKKTKNALFHASVPKAVLVAIADTILPNVCKMIHKYLTMEILKIQKNQIKQLLQYHAIMVAQNELQKYLTI
ncbi:37377_t:CDS:2, partial [Gigaspora margarita]